MSGVRLKGLVKQVADLCACTSCSCLLSLHVAAGNMLSKVNARRQHRKLTGTRLLF